MFNPIINSGGIRLRSWKLLTSPFQISTSIHCKDVLPVAPTKYILGMQFHRKTIPEFPVERHVLIISDSFTQPSDSSSECY